MLAYWHVDSIGSLAEATGDQKEAEAESLPQLSCHFSAHVWAGLPLTHGNPWQPMATHGPRQGLHLADPKSGLEALGECQDAVRIPELPLDGIGSFGKCPIPGSVAGFCGSKSYGDH